IPPSSLPPPFPYTTLFRSLLFVCFFSTFIKLSAAPLDSLVSFYCILQAGSLFGIPPCFKMSSYDYLPKIDESQFPTVSITVCTRSEEHTSELQSRFDLVYR